MKNARMSGRPYAGLLHYVNGVEVRVYFKTDDGRTPSTKDLNAQHMPPGWDLHVVYVNGKSVLELFKRSQGMTEFEVNQLLTVQSGGSYWKRVGKGDEKEPSAFGYEMERDDGGVRAQVFKEWYPLRRR